MAEHQQSVSSRINIVRYIMSEELSPWLVCVDMPPCIDLYDITLVFPRSNSCVIYVTCNTRVFMDMKPFSEYYSIYQCQNPNKNLWLIDGLDICKTPLIHHLNRNVREYAPSEDSDQPAHSRSLIRILTGRILDNQGYKVSSCGQRRLWSDCLDAQADLSLHWTHLSVRTFSIVAVQLIQALN